jgi:hypothetical protein
MGVRPDAPTSETIGSVTFYEIIKIEQGKRGKVNNLLDRPAKMSL